MILKKKVAIINYGVGNLYSIQQACKQVGLDAVITSEKEVLANTDAIILPGVGAFGDAMNELRKRNLVKFLKEQAQEGKILLGICLGMQLLMDESKEFGIHKGLGIIPGTTQKFEADKTLNIKVPQIGWNKITEANTPWKKTLLNELKSGEYMYFVHSFYVKPTNQDLVVATTNYGHINYCSAIQYKNTYGFQFHPERSGPCGLKIYHNLKKLLEQK